MIPSDPASPSPNRVLAAPILPIIAPLWLGAERPGVDLGAAALADGLRRRWTRTGREELAARLLPPVSLPIEAPADAATRLHRRALEFKPHVAAANQLLADAVETAIRAGELALTLGGDHALGIGSVAGASAACERLGLLWLDSHLDLNTPETSPTGHIHGMSVAVSLGYGPSRLVSVGRAGAKLRARDLCFLGTRDIDAGERAVMERHGIWMLTMEEWTDAGIVAGLQSALTHLTDQGCDAVHLSIDVDVFDPAILPGTGTPEVGGLTYREASQVFRALHAWQGPLRSIDVVELNPSLDPTGGSTAVAVALLATLLGETVR